MWCIISVGSKIIFCCVTWGDNCLASSVTSSFEFPFFAGNESNGRIHARIFDLGQDISPIRACRISFIVQRGAIEGVNNVLGQGIWDIDVLEGIRKRADDEGIIVCERTFDEIEADAASIDDDNSRNGRSGSVYDGCSESSGNQAEDVSRGLERLTRSAPCLRSTAVKRCETQLFPRVGDFASDSESAVVVEGAGLGISCVVFESETIPVQISSRIDNTGSRGVGG